MKAKWTVSDILNDRWNHIKRNKRYNPHQLRHLDAIRRCRTAALGGHLYKCNSCGAYHKRYNSCRNRHCPMCQNTQKQQWIEARQADLLPTTYYHVVFTIPATLNELCLAFPRQLYHILFQASWATLDSLGWDPKYLGAQMGATMVLHTWGQNISFHPHIHCIVPGGGISYHGKWKEVKSKGKFLFPVKVMSKLFRGKFVSSLKTFLDHQGLSYNAELHKLLYRKDWVVYCKVPFGGAKGAIEYLARYTHKIAISNHRILDVGDENVRFRYKDYRHSGKVKQLTLHKEEFVRRFCLHILPKGFTRIRHYGILSGRLKTKLLPQLKTIEKSSWDIYLKAKNIDVYQCPYCPNGRLILIGEIPKRGPPNFSYSSSTHI